MACTSTTSQERWHTQYNMHEIACFVSMLKGRLACLACLTLHACANRIAATLSKSLCCRRTSNMYLNGILIGRCRQKAFICCVQRWWLGIEVGTPCFKVLAAAARPVGLTKCNTPAVSILSNRHGRSEIQPASICPASVEMLVME